MRREIKKDLLEKLQKGEVAVEFNKENDSIITLCLLFFGHFENTTHLHLPNGDKKYYHYVNTPPFGSMYCESMDLPKEMTSLPLSQFFENIYEGNLEGFPDEVVQKMLEYQEKQGNKKDVKVFEKHSVSFENGFIWSDTPDGHDFWKKVITKKDFALFFSHYPKSTNIQTENLQTMNTKTKQKRQFPFILSYEDQKRILKVSDINQRDSLMEEWIDEFIDEKPVSVTKRFYEEMREFNNSKLDQVLDEIFGPDFKWPEKNVPLLIKSNDSWILRYSAGDGYFYPNGKKGGNKFKLNIHEWVVLDPNNLPVVE